MILKEKSNEMRKREELLKDAEGLADRDRLKIEIMLDMRDILEEIRKLKSRQMEQFKNDIV